MIDQDKLETMAQLALYEKKKGKKDFHIYSFDRDDYIRFQGLKTFVLVTMGFIAAAGIIVLWNLDYLIYHFDSLNYKGLIILVVAAYLFLVIFYLFLSYRRSKEEYHQVVPRIRRYQRGIKKMKEFYMIEDKQQRDFEKGEWRNGQ